MSSTSTRTLRALCDVERRKAGGAALSSAVAAGSARAEACSSGWPLRRIASTNACVAVIGAAAAAGVTASAVAAPPAPPRAATRMISRQQRWNSERDTALSLSWSIAATNLRAASLPRSSSPAPVTSQKTSNISLRFSAPVRDLSYFLNSVAQK